MKFCTSMVSDLSCEYVNSTPPNLLSIWLTDVGLSPLQDVENGRSRVAATERRAQAEARLAEAKGNLEVSKSEVSTVNSAGGANGRLHV